MNTHIAIAGAGQLARMLALEGIAMGLQFSFLVEPDEDTCCIRGLGDIVPSHGHTKKLYRQLGEPDVITVEKEQVDIESLEALQTYCNIFPNPGALSIFKHRQKEKQYLQQSGIPVAPYCHISSEEHLYESLSQLSQPVFLKSAESGYDGYHQYRVTDNNIDSIIDSIDFSNPWIAEGAINFDREVSFIAARDQQGNIVFYPAVENKHHNGTLLHSVAPAPALSEAMQASAQQYLRNLLDSTNYIGVMCMECFVEGEQLLVNEIAPRVHNSGHWTTKGARTSQFENHLRAIAGLPLGSTQTNDINGMLNLLGHTITMDQIDDHQSFVALYGKSPKPGRKLGHVIVNGDTHQDVATRLERIKTLTYDKSFFK